MKRRISLSIIITSIFLIVSVLLSTTQTNKTDHSTVKTTADISSTADEALHSEEEMRGLWVSYISLNMSQESRSFEDFKQKFDNIVKTALSLKCNTLIVHIRPFCDALYTSDIFPASHILSGTQGITPGYDALEYMCNSAHDKGLKIHGWINPYRVKNTSTSLDLSEDNPAVIEDDLTLKLDSGVYLNPAKKRVRKLITEGVKEIVENYDIDGIQFDDYFYPADINKSDSDDYNAYIKSLGNNSDAMSLEEWRINNINLLIAEVYKTIKSTNKNVVFGISPQGNIDNNYTIFADVKRWCEIYGYVDYICPQLYFSLDNPTLTFEEALSNWKNLSYHKSIAVYVGLGVYKAGSTEDDGTWQYRNDILAKELKLLREYSFDGYMLYDYNSLLSENTKKEVENLFKVINDNT